MADSARTPRKAAAATGDWTNGAANGAASGAAVDGIRGVLRLEGLALFAAAGIAFNWTGASWWLAAALFLVPDLSFAAYLAGPRLGAFGYNLAHSTVGPLALAGAGFALDWPAALGPAAVWLAHVGFDRALGYGLKYPTAFADTHLGRIGRPPG